MLPPTPYKTTYTNRTSYGLERMHHRASFVIVAKLEDSTDTPLELPLQRAPALSSWLEGRRTGRLQLGSPLNLGEDVQAAHEERTKSRPASTDHNLPSAVVVRG